MRELWLVMEARDEQERPVAAFTKRQKAEKYVARHLDWRGEPIWYVAEEPIGLNPRIPRKPIRAEGPEPSKPPPLGTPERVAYEVMRDVAEGWIQDYFAEPVMRWPERKGNGND